MANDRVKEQAIAATFMAMAGLVAKDMGFDSVEEAVEFFDEKEPENCQSKKSE